MAEVGLADVLTSQLKRAPDAERRHLILEVLGSLGESGEPDSHFSKSAKTDVILLRVV